MIPSIEGDVSLAALSRRLRSKSTKREEMFTLSQKGRPNPILASGKHGGCWVLTEGMLQRVPWAKLFSTRPENLF